MESPTAPTPTEHLDAAYSDDTAQAVPWAASLARLTAAELAWIVTVRPDGRPHGTPVVPVVTGGKVYFHTGRHEVKTANLAANPHVLALVGDTAWQDGLDVGVEGIAARVTDLEVLRRVAEVFPHRWDGRWSLDVDGGEIATDAASDAEIVVFEITPTVVRGHDKGDPFGQTTYRFAAPTAPTAPRREDHSS